MAQWGKITLWDAAADGNLEMCQKRLEASWTNINAKDAQGRAAIHEAARWGHAHVIEYLLDKGAERDITTIDGSTAAHLAAMHGRDEAVSTLIKRGTDVNIRDGAQDTPLIAAAARGHVSTVRLLLSLGADVTLKNRVGKTAAQSASTADVSAVFTENQHISPTKY